MDPVKSLTGKYNGNLAFTGIEEKRQAQAKYSKTVGISATSSSHATYWMLLRHGLHTRFDLLKPGNMRNSNQTMLQDIYVVSSFCSYMHLRGS